jgi:hypothetical protein
MATLDIHRAKAELCWGLARQYCDEQRHPFLCMNLIMYAVGHWIEAALALQDKHPSAPPRGVPHADRETQMRKHLVGRQWIEAEAADAYAELVATRHTFAEGGIQDRAFVERYLARAEPLVRRLQAVLASPPPATGS